MDKPEALRLSDALMETHPYPLDIKNAAAELRRLHAQRDALLEFARYVADIDPGNPAPLFVNARAAIEAVEGEKT